MEWGGLTKPCIYIWRHYFLGTVLYQLMQKIRKFCYDVEGDIK